MNLSKTLQFSVDKPSAEVVPLFTDLKKYVELHPLMVKTNLVKPNSYKLYERPFAWMPFSITYFAHVTQAGNEVSYVLDGIPFTKATFNYEFIEQSAGQTLVNLTISLRGLPVASSIIMRLMTDAQEVIFGSINN